MAGNKNYLAQKGWGVASVVTPSAFMKNKAPSHRVNKMTNKKIAKDLLMR